MPRTSTAPSPVLVVVQVKDFAQAFEIQNCIGTVLGLDKFIDVWAAGNLYGQENHAQYEDTLDREFYLWGRNREAYDHRKKAREAAGEPHPNQAQTDPMY